MWGGQQYVMCFSDHVVAFTWNSMWLLSCFYFVFIIFVSLYSNCIYKLTFSVNNHFSSNLDKNLA